MKNILKILFILTLINTTAGQENLTKIKLAVHWTPQAQFAGYYAGVEKGIFKKYGLDVELVHSAPGKTAQDMLVNEKVDFASMFLATAMYLKEENFNLVNICQLSQKSAQMFVVKKTSGIKKPEHFNNATVAIWRSGFDELPEAFMNKFNVDFEFVKADYPTNVFIFDASNAMTAMWYNEYHTVLNSGFNQDELDIFFFSDFGLNVPEDGIYCLEKNYDQTIVEKLRKAVIESWEYTFKNKKEMVEITKKIMDKTFTPFNRPHQMWMLSRMEDIFEFRKNPEMAGKLKKEDFDNAIKIYSSLGKLKKKINFEEFYRGE